LFPIHFKKIAQQDHYQSKVIFRQNNRFENQNNSFAEPAAKPLVDHLFSEASLPKKE